MYHSLSRAITTNHALSLVILSYHPSYNQDFSEVWNHPTPSNLSFDNVIPYPVLSRQILPYHFLLVITNLITKIFFRTLKSPTPLNLSFDTSFLIPCYHAKACLFVSLDYQPYNQESTPHPFEFILWWRHSLSRAITQILPYHLLSLAITHLITKIFQNSKITHPSENHDVIPLWIYFVSLSITFDVVSFLIPCYHHKSCLITCYP